jgi:hypothetical protein
MSPKELELLTWKGNSIKKVSMTPAPLFDIGVQQILHAFTPRSYFHGAVTCIDLGISSVSSCPPVTVVHQSCGSALNGGQRKNLTFLQRPASQNRSHRVFFDEVLLRQPGVPELLVRQ